jgi:cytosine/adenosine deaminase-related metal-dependent hydrolase
VQIFSARACLTGAGELLARGGILVDRGRIARVLRSQSALRRARAETSAQAIDLGDVVLAPGFVDAHSHLELSCLRGRLPRTGTFTEWIRALIAERARRGDGVIAGDLRAGADRLLATGTTAIGDIDSRGRVAESLRGHPLRLRLYREALDAGDPSRTATALAAIRRVVPRRAPAWRGISPHAPYTVSPPLFGELARLARRHRWPASIHWAETAEEVEWLERGSGPMSALLASSPRKCGLDLVAECGLLRPSTSLIHGNHVTRAERERVAASGAVLVHCPGTHAFFGRERFELESWTKLGVEVALGTDSLASNEDLDMRREMELLRQSHPELDPARVFDMATRAAARAIAFEGRAGELAPGAWADFCSHATEATKVADVLDAITSAETEIRGVWIAGRPAMSQAAPSEAG